MLLEANPMKKNVFAAAMLALFVFTPVSALAQSSDTAPAAYIPYQNMENVTPQQIDEARALGQSVVREMLDAYEKRPAEPEQTAKRIRQKFDDIADETMASERDKVLDFLGIDPTGNTGLYFFVSWSMPLEMLRSYAIEAMWAGGTLVLRGIPPGKDLAQFVTQDMQQLVYGKGAAANISIDPRLFDAYGVKSVPAIVFSTVRGDMQCQGVQPVAVTLENGQKANYEVCPGLNPDSFWMLSGAVTTNYALQTFIDDGAVAAKPYLNALSRGWAGQAAPAKEQRAFSGKWEDALSPSEKMAVKEAASAMSPVLAPAKP